MDGVILAGGKSTRMKTNKMLIEFDGHPLIWYAINGMKPFVDHLVVVTGKYDKEIREALKDEEVEIVTNHDYEKGMFSSVQTGLKRCRGPLFLLPGDCPFVQKETYEALLKGHEGIRVPSYKNKEGHPIYIASNYIDEILSLPLDDNLKRFRDSKKYEIISVRDKNIVINLNNVLDLIDIQN